MLMGMRIKEARIKKGLTQEQLGNLINVTKVSICCYEKGNRTPNLDTLLDLAKVLDLTLDEMIGRDYLVIKEATEDYNAYISKEELMFLNELRKYGDLYKRFIEEPKRSAELIIQKLK